MSFLSCGEGRVGHGDCHSACPRNCDKPRLIEALKSRRIRDIACGSSHSAALTSSGELYTWGLGEYGRLGHGDNATQLKPKMVITRSRRSRARRRPPGRGRLGLGVGARAARARRCLSAWRRPLPSPVPALDSVFPLRLSR